MSRESLIATTLLESKNKKQNYQEVSNGHKNLT